MARGGAQAKSVPGRIVMGSAALALALACASCSSQGPSAPSSTLTVQQVIPPLVQCFISHHLIPSADLNAGANARPPESASTWLKHGRLIANLRFGGWYRDVGAGVKVSGRSVADWAAQVVASPRAWPTGICGPMPTPPA